MIEEEQKIIFAKYLHDQYEKASKEEGWNTQESCKVEFEDLPAKNQAVMKKLAEKAINFIEAFQYNYLSRYGWLEGRIEQIGTGKQKDTLMISNRKPNLWILNLFNGYRQIGTFKINKPHQYKEGENILVKMEEVMKKGNFLTRGQYYLTHQIIQVKKDP